MHMRAITATILLFFGTTTCVAQGPSSYSEASERATSQENSPAIREYLSDTFRPSFERDYGSVIQSCIKTVEQPDDSPFSFVAVIGNDGHVLDVFGTRTT